MQLTKKISVGVWLDGTFRWYFYRGKKRFWFFVTAGPFWLEWDR